MTPRDLELTKKYLNDYSDYCNNRECGCECPVFVEHERHPERSCFMIYCELRESNIIGVRNHE